MKKIQLIPSLIVMLLLAGCMPSIGQQDEELIQDTEENEPETVIIPDVQLKEEYYRTLLPFKKSASRGLIVGNIYSKYDMEEVEEGLLRLSAKSFAPDNHFFQEGQYITEEMARSWIQRNSEDNQEGLNPAIKEGMSEDEIAEKAPSYLAHIVEQNYLTMTEEKKVSLSGISIGLALNSIYYTRSGKETKISDAVLEKEGTRMAEEIVKRMRTQEGLENVPIVIGLFKQQSRDAIIPGNYFATTVSEKGEKTSGWKKVEEEYVLFPSSQSEDAHRDTNTKFRNFKKAIDDYFPSFINVVGRGLYVNDSLQSLKIEMPIQFFGKSETIGFTQYITGLIPQYLPDVPIEISITSINGPEALIVKEQGKEEPYVHIYGY